MRVTNMNDFQDNIDFTIVRMQHDGCNCYCERLSTQTPTASSTEELQQIIGERANNVSSQLKCRISKKYFEKEQTCKRQWNKIAIPVQCVPPAC